MEPICKLAELDAVDIRLFAKVSVLCFQSAGIVTDLFPSYDPSPSILKYPLPAKSSNRHEAKRSRHPTTIQGTETIERKILDGGYASFDDVLEDIEALTQSVLKEKTNGTLSNGVSTEPNSKAKAKIVAIHDFLTQASRRHSESMKQDVAEAADRDLKVTLNHDMRDAGQVLTVRSQTSTGPRQLFSGLQRSARLEAQGDHNDVTVFDIAAPIDLKRLPNGFDVVEPLPLEAHTKRKEEKEIRSFGEVFAAHRDAKPLEVPRPSQMTPREKSLDFLSLIETCYAQQSEPVFKADHIYSALPTGQWLRYKEDQAKTDSLFQVAYSSFAPSYDDSAAVISQRTRTDLWWQKHSRSSVVTYPEDVSMQTTSANILEDDFTEAVSCFQPNDTSDDAVIATDSRIKDVEDVLREVSDLLQTLSSYQRIRNLELSGSTSAVPSTLEFDTYEILRSQLSIMIGSLPPFAVAKLDGDQLGELGVGTTLVSRTNEYTGIGEADDAEMQRRRAKLAATAAASRTPAPAQTTARPSTYQASTTSYGIPPYNPRGALPYQTSRTPSASTQRPTYSQAQYSSSPAHSQPTSLQQFQRPMPNGYPSYNAAPAIPHAGQQKPMVNGHRPSMSSSTMAAASPIKTPILTPQQQMLQERQAEVIRMAAGNATSGFSGYNANSEKKSETPKTEVQAE